MGKKFEATWDSLDQRKMPEWYQNAKFGIFIHWGVYSVPAWRQLNVERFGSYAEWYYASVYGNFKNYGDDFHQRIYGDDYEYREFAKDFNAELFDPEYWAELFNYAGAKYVVLTSKHHDGYSLWPSDNPHKKNWRVGDVGPKRDLVGDLTEAVRNRGMRMGLYYSIVDWETNWSHRPEGGYFVPKKDREKYGIDEDKYPDEILIPQMKELVNKYSPAVIFTDGGEWDFSEEYSQVKEFMAWLYNEAPNKDEVVINDRFCVGMPGRHGDYFSTEYKDVDGFGDKHPWEESRGIGGSYGFNRAENLLNYNSSEQLIHELIEIVSNGGNLLLNVGPTADGRIPIIQQQRLKDIGDWMAVNDSAIFDTNPTVKIISSNEKLFFTENDNRINIILTDWIEDYINLEKNESFSVSSIKLLGFDGKIEFEDSENKLKIKVPNVSPKNFKVNHAYVFSVKF